ncbi:acyltransferase [Latilactobacillus curvatus]|uniref:acyltransferase family protein n=1 Tax=Latilactobacillus curvatus TaxID=28038 RepID=UPI0009772030|nr:acyltransferase [Latilactobacillus curvatus]MCT1216201.1 acyltransferase [Latilactobacillus curvatus]
MKRLDNIVIMRVFAIITVVMGHSMIIFSDSWNYYQLSNSSQFFNYFKIIINIYQMPIFFFVSGYLFYYLKVELGKYESKKKFLNNKFKRLVIPYFFVAIFYMVPLRILGSYPNYINKSFFEIILRDIILGADSGNLWFLPVLFLIFFFFRYIFFSEKLEFMREKYYLWLIIFLICANISVLVPNVLFVKNFLQYLIYFFLGYSFKEVIMPSKITFSRKGLIILLAIGSMSFFQQVFFVKGNSIYLAALRFNVNVLSAIASCILIYIISDKIILKDTSIANNVILKKIDEDSFGIYLFHSPLLYPILNQLNGKYINPFILVPLLFIFILLSSWGITLLLSSNEYTKFIVGK